MNAIHEAKAKGYDLVIVDTAGRLAIDEQMMNEIEAGDILADAKAINESRAAEAAQEVIEDTAEQPAEQTAQ